jgi:hypothetical protein
LVTCQTRSISARLAASTATSLPATTAIDGIPVGPATWRDALPVPRRKDQPSTRLPPQRRPRCCRRAAVPVAARRRARCLQPRLRNAVSAGILSEPHLRQPSGLADATPLRVRSSTSWDTWLCSVSKGLPARYRGENQAD